MRPKTFKIIYMLDGKTMNTQCSIYYLHKYIDKLIEDGSRIICIFANPKLLQTADVAQLARAADL